MNEAMWTFMLNTAWAWTTSTYLDQPQNIIVHKATETQLTVEVRGNNKTVNGIVMLSPMDDLRNSVEKQIREMYSNKEK